MNDIFDEYDFHAEPDWDDVPMQHHNCMNDGLGRPLFACDLKSEYQNCRCTEFE